jgi:hypothetical protein
MRGRSPAQIPETPLPSNYKSVANKVTMVIVAMPILLVTSWVLYERCELFIYLFPSSPAPCVRSLVLCGKSEWRGGVEGDMEWNI